MVKARNAIYVAVIVVMNSFFFSFCHKEDGCVAQTWYKDADGDGFGDPAVSIPSCEQPQGHVADNTDFDDANATAHPGAIEICNDGIDNDGDGKIDCLDSDCSGDPANARDPWIYKPGVAENLKGIIRSTDPNAFKEIEYKGREIRNMFDRRIPGRTGIFAHVFDVRWLDKGVTRIYVNPEESSFEHVATQAEKHAKTVGLLPYFLRSLIDRVDLHMGLAAYGGGNRGVLLYAERTEEHETVTNKLHEIIVHEAGHNLGNLIGTAPGWVAVQNSDNAFISKYAAEAPQTEDVSESILAWLILRYHRDRITDEQAKAICDQIPARLQYFDDQNYNMYPVVRR